MLEQEELVQRLIEEALDGGLGAEEVCRAHPEALGAVAAGLAKARAVELELEALFPPPAAARDARSLPRELPAIGGYELESVLGRGGMGVVYRARHAKLDRPVAIKMLLAGAYAAPSEVERFRREAEAIARLRHPHVVQVYDVGEADGRPYIAMELVEGRTLAQELAGEPQPARRAAELALSLAGAVEAAHAAGIVHRDLKPANVLIDVDGAPKITDFGLARRIDGEAALTLSGARLGTPSYMAPEQALGHARAIGPAVDVYALGALLYEALTGRPPFRGESAAETERQVIADEPVPPSRLNAKVPRDLETIALKCLRKEPGARYAGARELALDLRRFLRGEPIVARPIGWSGRAARWVRRNPTGSALVVCVLALVAAAIGLGARELADAARTRVETERWSERLAFVHQLLDEGRFVEARAILGRVPDAGSSGLRARIEDAQRELDLVEGLDAIRMGRAQSSRLDFDLARADDEYARAFAQAGYDVLGGEPGEVAARIAAAGVHAALVASLDDWAACARGSGRWNRVLEIARRADPDPWRDRARSPEVWEGEGELKRLVEEVPPASLTVPLAMALASFYDRRGGDASGFLRRVQSAHPSDFWANFLLAEVLSGDESIGYYRAALALRPDASAVHVNLGLALLGRQRVDEAIEAWRRAVELDPRSTAPHTNLGFALLGKARYGEVLDEARAISELDPRNRYAYELTGRALSLTGRFREASEAAAAALELAPADDPFREQAEGLAQECERLAQITPELDGVLDGDRADLAPEELGWLAEITLLGRRYASAAELYARWFDAAEGRSSVPEGARYNAACVAALAGTERDLDPRVPSPEARAAWHRTARQWLEEELERRLVAAEAEGEAGRARLAEELAEWRQDPDLASVRDAGPLAGASEAERAACAALWGEVDELLADVRSR